MTILFLLRLTILWIGVLLCTGFLCLPARSAPGDIDRSFDAGSGIDGWAEVFTVQPDGKVIMAGPFSAVKGLTRHYFARLNADGTGDSSFAELDQNLGISGFTALVMQPDGKVMMGHARGLTRFNSDGTDDTFFLRTYADGGLSRPVGAVALQPDGRILIGGDFSVVENSFLRGIARVNPNGKLDPTFDPGSGINDGFARVSSIAVQPDGKILIGGYLLGFNGTPVIHIARLHANGSLDQTFSPSFGVEDSIYSIALQPDGKVLVGGFFDHGTGRHPIERLHTDGSLDRSFDAGQTLGAGWQIAVLPDGKMLVRGLVQQPAGGTGTVVRLNADGSPDTGFNAAWSVDRFVLQADGRLLINGTAPNGSTGLARLHADGSLDAAFQPDGGVKGQVMSLAGQPDGKVLIGGSFAFINGISRRGVARLNGNGSLDSSFVPAPGINPSVQQIRLQPDGKVLVGGYSTTDDFGGTVRGEIIRLNTDGGQDAGFNPGTGADGTVSLITLEPDGKILIGGSFGTVNGVSRPGFARLHVDGSLDIAFTPDIGSNSAGSLLCIVRQPDGKVLTGGHVETLVNGTIRGGLTRFNADGSRDSPFNPVLSGYVQAIALLPDGKILIGGYFSTAGAVTAMKSLARLHPDGSLDSGFYVPEAAGENAGMRGVGGLLLQPDGKFLCRGTYQLGVDSEGYQFFMASPFRLNPDGSFDGSFYARLGGVAMELQADGRLLIGGGYLPGSNIGRLHGDLTTPSLNIALTGGTAVLSWPVAAGNLQLQETADLSLPGSWSPVSQAPAVNGNQINVTVPLTSPRRFFRLSTP